MKTNKGLKHNKKQRTLDKSKSEMVNFPVKEDNASSYSSLSNQQSQGGKKMDKKKQEKEKRKSEWLIISPSGQIGEAKDFDWSNHESLQTFYQYESAGSRVAKDPPAHIKIMQKLELVDYESAADPGNFRWLPKGHLMKRLMESHVSKIVKDYGGMQVESPIMYDLKHPQLSKYLARFPARQYQLLSGQKKYFLRFAACFGQYLIMHDMQISYNHLPVKIYELSHYSFRRELGGELAGLRRLRGFTMPDMHTLCADTEQAKKEFYHQYQLCKKWMTDLDLEYVMAIRVVEDFYNQNKEFLMEIARDFGQPILLEKWEKRFFYFILKFEFNFVDEQKKAAALSTVQVDVENSERFDIRYIDKNGESRHPLLLHASISGSIDRNLYALLEQEAKKLEKGEAPKFPYWLSPAQIRLIPIADRHIEYCKEIASQIMARVEIDDRNETVSKKIREAEINWAPLIGIIGDKEIRNGSVSLRDRITSEQSVIQMPKLQEKVAQLQGDKPFEQISWPILISKQPRFH